MTDVGQTEKLDHEDNAESPHPKRETADVQLKIDEGRYRTRLLEMWAVVVGLDEERDEHERERTLFIDAMQTVGAVIPAGATEDEIEGDAAAVRVQVVELVRDAPVQALEDLIRLRLPATIARLDYGGRSTPEDLVDIVATALFPLRQYPAAGTLALALASYVHRQGPGERTPGWYATLVNLGNIITGVKRPETLAGAAVLYHTALAAIREALISPSTPDPDRMIGFVVRNATFNLAAGMADLAQRSQLPPGARDVLRDLKAISAAWASERQADQVLAEAVIEGLRLQRTGRVEDVLTVLVDMGALAMAWERVPVNLARLEAASGLAMAATQNDGDPGARLFNAGISLGRDGGNRDQKRTTAQLVVNIIGLRLALMRSDDLVTAMLEYSGLDCAVNLAGAYSRYSEMVQPEDRVLKRLQPLVHQVLALAEFPLLRSRAPAVEVARLKSSASSLAYRVPSSTLAPEIGEHIYPALRVISEAMGMSAPDDNDDLTVDAKLIGHTFGDYLDSGPDTDTADLETNLSDLVSGRSNPEAVLTDRYERYADGSGTTIGPGPLVVAGFIDIDEWRRRVRASQSPRPIIASLSRFSLASTG